MRLEWIRGWRRVAAPLVGIVLVVAVPTGQRLASSAQNQTRPKQNENSGLAVSASKNSDQGSDFTVRCRAPGVVRCFGFDARSEIAGNWGDNVGTLPNYDGRRPEIDTTVKASGSGSLRFTIPPDAGADSSGAFFANFSTDLATQFGEGQEFYVQWRQRFGPGMVRGFRTDPPGGTGGYKLAIVGEGDQPGQPIAGSCTEMENVLTTDYRFMGPTFYHGCGRFIPLEFNDHVQIRMQRQGPPYCYYPNDPQGGCFKHVANEWLTYQMHIQIGRWNTPSSRIQIWAARQGQRSVMIDDSIDAFPGGMILYMTGPPSSNPNARYGKVWLTPYHTNKDRNETYPTAYTWYDELIISRQRVPDPK